VNRLLQISVLLALPLALTPSLGCKKSDDKGDKEEKVEVLPEANNGSPVAAKFVEFIGEGDERGMKVLVYNHGEETAAGMTMTFYYFDGDDKPLKVKEGTAFEGDSDFTSVSGGRYKVKPKKNGNYDIEGMMVAVPAAAERVEIEVTRVDKIGADGNAIEPWWKAEG